MIKVTGSAPELSTGWNEVFASSYSVQETDEFFSGHTNVSSDITINRNNRWDTINYGPSLTISKILMVKLEPSILSIMFSNLKAHMVFLAEWDIRKLRCAGKKSSNTNENIIFVTRADNSG